MTTRTFTPVNEHDTRCECGVERDQHRPGLVCPPLVVAAIPDDGICLVERMKASFFAAMTGTPLVDPDGERYRPELVAVGEWVMPESQDAADVAREQPAFQETESECPTCGGAGEVAEGAVCPDCSATEGD